MNAKLEREFPCIFQNDPKEGKNPKKKKKSKKRREEKKKIPMGKKQKIPGPGNELFL